MKIVLSTRIYFYFPTSCLRFHLYKYIYSLVCFSRKQNLEADLALKNNKKENDGCIIVPSLDNNYIHSNWCKKQNTSKLRKKLSFKINNVSHYFNLNNSLNNHFVEHFIHKKSPSNTLFSFKKTLNWSSKHLHV